MQNLGNLISLFREQIGPESQKALYDYWRSKCRSGHLPSRADIEPTEMPLLLPDLGLIDILPNDDFRYRLVGTSMVYLFDRDFTGTLVSASKPGIYGIVLKDMYRQVRDSRRPIYSKSRFIYETERPVEMRRLVLPLADKDNNVNMLLFSTVGIRPRYTLNPNLNVIEDSLNFIEYQRIIEGEMKHGLRPQKEQKQAV